MFRASCFCFPLKLGLIIPSPPGWSLESSSVWGESPIQFGFCFSTPSDLWAGFSEMVGAPHGQCWRPLLIPWTCWLLCRILCPWCLPAHPDHLSFFEFHHVVLISIGGFLCLLLRDFLSLLNSANSLSSGFYSPLSRSFLPSANFITIFMQRTAVSLPGGCPFVCRMFHTLKVEPSNFSYLFSNCLFLCQCVQSPIFPKRLVFETS